MGQGDWDMGLRHRVVERGGLMWTGIQGLGHGGFKLEGFGTWSGKNWETRTGGGPMPAWGVTGQDGVLAHVLCSVVGAEAIPTGS